MAVGIFLGLALFAGVVFNLSPKVDAAQRDASAAIAKVEEKQDEERTGRLKLGSLRNLEGQARVVRQQSIELRSYIDGLAEELADLGAWFELIETITESTRPDTVTVGNLVPEGDRFKLSGNAPTLEDAVQYTVNIRDSGLFVDVNITHVSAIVGASGGAGVQDGSGEPGPRVVSFQITATAKGASSDDADEGDGE